ncbi:MAG: hypothetical protein LBS24_01450, partial [Clostridiales Family XIII bacterium]|nr:hypothetical protein [Clostridiales Family XIII bacterium]
GADNVYVEVGADGALLGEWHYDDERGEWVFDKYPPGFGILPQTGAVWTAETGAAAPTFPAGLSLLALAALAALAMRKLRKGPDA